jgi:GNAT superfamily N-acetyltransferase
MTPSTITSGPDPMSAVSVAIRGGVATLRPLGPGEVEVLDAVFDGLSPDSRYNRYLTGVPRLTGQMRSILTAVDGSAHIAWVAEVGGRPAAIGRLIRLSPATAEMALEVTDVHQGRGLGTALLDTLMTVASVSGIHTIRATVLSTNQRSLSGLRSIGMRFAATGRVIEGTAEVRLLSTPAVDRAAVVRLALTAHADRRGRLDDSA